MLRSFLIKINLAAALLLLFCSVAQSQSTQADFNLLKKYNIKRNQEGDSNPPAKGIGSAYRRHIHTQLGSHCFYEITCLDFSKSLIKEFGIFKGSFLTIDRIGRCNAISFSEILPSRISKTNLIMEVPLDYRIRP